MNYMLLQNSILLTNHSSVITGVGGAGVLRLQTPPPHNPKFNIATTLLFF